MLAFYLALLQTASWSQAGQRIFFPDQQARAELSTARELGVVGSAAGGKDQTGTARLGGNTG